MFSACAHGRYSPVHDRLPRRLLGFSQNLDTSPEFTARSGYRVLLPAQVHDP